MRTLGVDPGRVDVTLLGVRPSRARRADGAGGAARARHGLTGAPLVLSVAQKRPYKNVAAIVRAVAALGDLPSRPS